MQWPTEKAEWEQRILCQNCWGITDFLMNDVFIFFFSLYLYFFNETSLYLGPEDIFIAFTGICYPLWEWVAWVACLLMSILFFVIRRLFFFAIIFGFVDILFGVFQPEKPFFIIGEEENFLDSLFLVFWRWTSWTLCFLFFEDEALLIWSLMSNFRSLLTFEFIHPVGPCCLIEMLWSTGAAEWKPVLI